MKKRLPNPDNEQRGTALFWPLLFILTTVIATGLMLVGVNPLAAVPIAFLAAWGLAELV